MTPAFKLYEFISTRTSGENGKSLVNGLYVKTRREVTNDYYHDKLPTIPAGTWLRLDFGGDFGLYAMADIDGDLHKVKVLLPDVASLDWSEYQHRIDAMGDQ